MLFLRSKRRPQSTAKAAESEMGNYPKRWFPIALYALSSIKFPTADA